VGNVGVLGLDTVTFTDDFTRGGQGEEGGYGGFGGDGGLGGHGGNGGSSKNDPGAPGGPGGGGGSGGHGGDGGPGGGGGAASGGGWASSTVDGAIAFDWHSTYSGNSATGGAGIKGDCTIGLSGCGRGGGSGAEGGDGGSGGTGGHDLDGTPFLDGAPGSDGGSGRNGDAGQHSVNGSPGEGINPDHNSATDTIPPDTNIDSGPSGNTSDDTPTFTFSSNEPGSTFQCRFDIDPGFFGCESGITTTPLAPGPHTFKVRAIDAVGQEDPTPASRSFTVTGPPQLSVSDVSKPEGNSGTTTFAFKVTLDAATSDTVTADFQTRNGTAVSPSDYTARTGTVTFAAGQTVKTVNVSVKGDVGLEPIETFSLLLSDPSGATIADADGTGTIKNDDTATCLGSTATKVGTPGNDTINGTAGIDVINGLGGNDTIFGLGAGDKLCGDAGNDTVNGGPGNDHMDGGTGNDAIKGLDGRDTMIGGPGTDRCDGGPPAGSPGDSATTCETKIGVP
jgi:hypothetical protein